MDVTAISQSQAQKRVEQIHAFKRELAQLKQQKILSLTPQQTANIPSHHLQLTSDLSNTFDIDINVKSKQLSLGMKIASLAGALAMASSLFFLFYQFWGTPNNYHSNQYFSNFANTTFYFNLEAGR